MNWFAKNGDKVLSLATVFLGLVAANAAALGVNAHAAMWATVIGTGLTAAHTLIYPNSQVVAVPSAAQVKAAS
jgi:hypothetical protein